MSPIRVQSPTGEERSFSTREEFGRAVASRLVRQDWLVYHRSSDCWVPVTAHPAFRDASAADRGAMLRPRSSDLVLIYPDGSVQVRTSGPQEPSLESARLTALRWSGENAVVTNEANGTTGAPPPRRSGGTSRPGSSLPETARKAAPAFLRALFGFAWLITPKNY